MPRLPPASAEDVARVARKLGFVLDRQKGSHAVYFRLADRRRVVIPMHRGDLKRGTLQALVADLGLGVEEFSKLM